jgi:acyl-CoA dehydrogenase
VIFPLGKPYDPPGDHLIHQAASVLLTESPTRDRLTAGIHINEKPDDPTGRIEVAFKAVLAAAPVEAKIHLAQKQGRLPKGDLAAVLEEACTNGLISPEEVHLLELAEQARWTAITVDEFSPDELAGNRQAVDL